MPYPRQLPDCDVLAMLIRRHNPATCPISSACAGTRHTYVEIGAAFDVSENAVYQAMERCGLTSPHSERHNDVLPWTVLPEHRYKRPAEMLRLLGRFKRGNDLPPVKRRMLERWMDWMRELDQVVVYDPATQPNEASDTGRVVLRTEASR